MKSRPGNRPLKDTGQLRHSVEYGPPPMLGALRAWMLGQSMVEAAWRSFAAGAMRRRSRPALPSDGLFLVYEAPEPATSLEDFDAWLAAQQAAPAADRPTYRFDAEGGFQEN